MSSWFGGGSSSSSSSSSSPSDYSSPSSSSYDSFSSYPPPPPPPSYSSPSGGLGASSGLGSSASISSSTLEQALLQEQERAAISAAMSKLKEICFEKCVGYPDSKLSSSEQTCIMNTTGRYLDTSMFVMGRLMRQSGGGLNNAGSD